MWTVHRDNIVLHISKLPGLPFNQPALQTLLVGCWFSKTCAAGYDPNTYSQRLRSLLIWDGTFRPSFKTWTEFGIKFRPTF